MDRNTPYMDPQLLSVPMAAVSIGAGKIVCANASGFATSGAVAANLTYLGRSEEAVDNSGGSAGDKAIQVRRKLAFKWKNDGDDPVTQALFGKTCYILDDETVSASHDDSARSAAGIVVGVEADGIWVE